VGPTASLDMVVKRKFPVPAQLRLRNESRTIICNVTGTYML